MKRLARVVFWGYAVALFVATHWPKLVVEWEGIDRPDLYIHMTAFGGWTLLLTATGYLSASARDPLAEAHGVRGWMGEVLRPRAVALSGLVAIAYAGFDELTQGIPGLGRTAAWDDFGANCAGIVLGVVVALTARWLGRRKGVGVSGAV